MLFTHFTKILNNIMVLHTQIGENCFTAYI